MPSHKSEDYKITAVKFHLENESSFVNTCKIFKCSERSLKRWIEKYCAKGNNTTLHEPIVLLFPIKLHKNRLKMLYNYSKKTNRLR